MVVNSDRPVGPLIEFRDANWPDRRALVGAHVRLEKVDPARHANALWDQFKGYDFVWNYLLEEAPQDEAAFSAALAVSAARADWLGYAICDLDGSALGYAFYLNIVPAMGTIEIGNINFSPVCSNHRPRLRPCI